MSGTICPWCDSEIRWDPEIGPEKECPYCLNELQDYRSLKLSVDSEPEPEEKLEREGRAIDLERGFAQEEDMDALEALNEFEAFRADYRSEVEEAVDVILDAQDEIPECLVCREGMIWVGTEIVDAGSFQAKQLAPLHEALLDIPFKREVYLCPSCFQMQHQLAEEDRENVINRLQSYHSTL